MSYLESAARGRAEALDEVGDPRGLKCRAVQHVRVERIVADHRLPSPHAVARLGKPLPVAIVLRAVDAAVEAGELRPVRAELRDVLDHGDRDHRYGVAGLAAENEVVASLPWRRARLRNALEVPIRATVVGVQLPVVARRVVATVPMQRRVQVLQLRGRRVCHAIYRGIDRTTVGADIHRHRNSRVLCVQNRNGGANSDDNSGARHSLSEGHRD